MSGGHSPLSLGSAMLEESEKKRLRGVVEKNE